MFPKRILLLSFLIVAVIAMVTIFPNTQRWARVAGIGSIVAGQNVNMVSGTTLPGGDPYLQRQNEPSMAVSTRNPLHLLAGANDYRTVDIPIVGEELPGLYEQAAAGDAWLGVFTSVDGSQSWTSTLLPGYPQDITAEGLSSPLKGLQAAADPTVRAGSNGIFYYSGIAFNRIKNGRSVIFVARYIDNNNVELAGSDPIEYIDTQIIDEGTSGQFGDKPWLAVGAPLDDNDTVPIVGNPIPYQEISRHNVYITYSMFLGDLAQNVHNKILFARSTDCGNSWNKPIKLSESQRINQGTMIAVSPLDGTIYVVWRRFASGDDSNAILFVKSKDGGQKFTKPKEVISINPFDQGTSTISFRTNSFPALAVDGAGIVYLAWAEKGMGPEGDARIMLMTSGNEGNSWNGPLAIDNHNAPGHQIMPTLSFAAGRLTAAWYDFRNDESGLFEMDYIREIAPIRHTVDVRAIQGFPGVNPSFGASIQVSKYLWALYEDPPGQYHFQQVQFNPPNYPLFKAGTVPFHGDYIDITPSPMFLRDFVFSPMSFGASMGSSIWRFNTEDSDPSDFHVTWTDNRDVVPPIDNIWTDYNAPEPGCIEEDTGMRNQNVYTSKLTDGILIGSPVNFKPPGSIQHAFIVFVKNTTGLTKHFRLTISASSVMASFLQFDPDKPTVEVSVPPHSSICRPVFVWPTSAPILIGVEVTEISAPPNGDPIPGGFQDIILLNLDPTNPINNDIVNYESHDPEITNVNILNWDLSNVNILNPNVVDVNILNTEVMDVNILNPNNTNVNILNANVIDPFNVNILNVNILNVNILNSAIGEQEFDPQTTRVSDLQWTVTNTGNSTSSFTFRTIAGESLPEGIYSQLLVYKIHLTPYAAGCSTQEDERHELLVNIQNVNILNPNLVEVNILNPDLENSDIANATFFLAPGEEAVVNLRVIDPDYYTAQGTVNSQSSLETQDFVNKVGAAVTAHAVNSDGEINPIDTTPLQIITYSLPDGSIDNPYTTEQGGDVFIRAFGGTEPYSWAYSGTLPPGLDFYPITNPDSGNISDTAKISGTPTTWGTYTFTVSVSDPTTPPVSQTLTIHVLKPLEITTESLLINGIKNAPYNTTLDAEGGVPPYSWNLVDVEGQKLPDGLILESDGTIHGTPLIAGSFSFTAKVTDSSEEPQEVIKEFNLFIAPLDFEITTDSLPDGYVETSYNATLAAINGEGLLNWSVASGTIPPGLELSLSGEITGKPLYDPDADYPEEYSFTVKVLDSFETPQERRKDLSITIYPKKEEWAERYEGSGDDEAAAIVVDDSGDVYVTGSSMGDFLTIKYGSIQDSYGMLWAEVYDGPAHLNDGAAGIALDPAGNVYVTGFSTGETTGEDSIIIKYDPNGNRIWERIVDGPAHLGDRTNDIVIDSTGIYATGYGYRGMQFSHSDGRTMKYDFDGNLIWEKMYDSQRNGMDEGCTVALDSSGVYVAMRSEESSGSDKEKDYDYYTEKYDKNTGETIWETRYDGPAQDDDEPFAIALDSLHVYITGRSQGGATGSDYATVKYTKADGIEQWVARTDGAGNEEAAAVATDNAGNVFVTGFTAGTTGTDYSTIKYLGNGNKDWGVAYNGPGNGDDKGIAVAVDSTGVYVTGFVTGESTDPDIFTIKYDFDGDIVWSATYSGPGSGIDVPVAIALDSSYIYVIGTSEGEGTAKDLITIKYQK
jgi:hypothetical protein